MGAMLNFLEVLEKKIKQQILKESQQKSFFKENSLDFSNELSGFSDYFINFDFKLMNHEKLSRLGYKNYYEKLKSSNVAPLILNKEEQKALDYVNSCGANLSNPFTLRQVLKSKRRLMLKMHPDHGGAHEEFCYLLLSFNILEIAIKKIIRS